MTDQKIDIKDIHWLMDMLQSIDVGLIVLDRQYRVQVWNDFMVNHSNRSPTYVMGQNIFGLFDDISEDWLKRKAESVFLLKSRSFATWEQRPYLFRFKNYRPITGTADFMYQNITFIPLVSAQGDVNHVGIIIYDVTDIAVGKMQLETANEKLQTLSRTDGLTQLNNRRYWEECLKSEFQRVKRTGQISALLMFDIDHFKKINDTYGHQAGDEVIRETAGTLRKAIRTTDIAGRYGGEEFTVILINTNAEQAMVVAERLRKRIEALSIQHEGHTINYTISLGISEFHEEMNGHTQWLEYADSALYDAKRGGRNQAVISKASAG